MYSGVRREWNLEYAYRTTEINFSFVYVLFPPVEDPLRAITHHTDRPSDRDNNRHLSFLLPCLAAKVEEERVLCKKNTDPNLFNKYIVHT